MNKLKEEFRRKGINYTQLDRQKDIALYEQTDDDDHTIGFEVFIVKSHNGRYSPDGKTWIEPAEFPPSDTQWGVYGWSFYDEVKARKKFDKVVAKQD